MAFGSI
jgi:hypothetical protein